MGDALFNSVVIGGTPLRNRVVMAPVGRGRAPGGVPTVEMRDFYAQRADAGLIITECTRVSPESAAYPFGPALDEDRHVEPWRTITDAIHERGGVVYAQLWHAGRVGHVSLQPGGRPPVAPSAIAGDGELMTATGYELLSQPSALSIDEIEGIVRAFAAAARRARTAGFDGVELHGGYGYLPEQFLLDGSNARDDEFGGSVANRARFLFDVISTLQQVFGPSVGLKLTPGNRHYGSRDGNPAETFDFVLDRLNASALAYLQVTEATAEDRAAGCAFEGVGTFARQAFNGPLIANGGFDGASAEHAIVDHAADLVSFGTHFIANPDLTRRLRERLPLAAPDWSTVYYRPGTPLAKGYSDYPPYADVR